MSTDRRCSVGSELWLPGFVGRTGGRLCCRLAGSLGRFTRLIDSGFRCLTDDPGREPALVVLPTRDRQVDPELRSALVEAVEAQGPPDDAALAGGEETADAIRVGGAVALGHQHGE